MYCTVAGLCVAIPALIAYSLFSRHIEALTIDLETLCSELLGKIYTQSETQERRSTMQFARKRRRQPFINIISLIDILVGVADLLHRHDGLQADGTEAQHRGAALDHGEGDPGQRRPRPSTSPPTARSTWTTRRSIRTSSAQVLKSKKAANPNFKVAMKSDQNAPFRIIVKIMDAANQAHITNLQTYMNAKPAERPTP